MKLSKEQWRIAHSNEVRSHVLSHPHSAVKLMPYTSKGFALCATYPRRIIVPAAVDDALLIESARLRQQGCRLLAHLIHASSF